MMMSSSSKRANGSLSQWLTSLVLNLLHISPTPTEHWVCGVQGRERVHPVSP